ncbi:MAG: site-specific integrase [Dysgonamonadaceae bacterium]|jgi:integrase|nr:site-specific integrase [Dysgonamonadaceae bacterium]
MATFNPAVRTKDREFNTVYIRISHNSKTDYIKTTMSVHKSGIKKGEIADRTILANCWIKIKQYTDKLNNLNIESWTIKEIKQFLAAETSDISFSDFARKYIDKMRVAGRRKPANNYTCALNSLEKHYGKSIYFSDITSKELRNWIEILSSTTKRAKNMYPVLVKKLFDEGCMEYNDYDRNIIKISGQPFKTVRIPDADVPSKRTTDAETIRKILAVSPSVPREVLARDVLLLVLYLMGINTVDLYNIDKTGLRNGKLCYNRTKTEGKRKDKAYIEVLINEEILPLLEKYKGGRKLFNFSEHYANSDIFLTAVNKGLKSLCLKAGIQKITVYWLRHTWATIAQNKCGASTELVGFCLNHASAHRITEGYIEKDFSPVDILNRKVLNYIFECSQY